MAMFHLKHLYSLASYLAYGEEWWKIWLIGLPVKSSFWGIERPQVSAEKTNIIVSQSQTHLREPEPGGPEFDWNQNLGYKSVISPGSVQWPVHSALHCTRSVYHNVYFAANIYKDKQKGTFLWIIFYVLEFILRSLGTYKKCSNSKNGFHQCLCF